MRVNVIVPIVAVRELLLSVIEFRPPKITGGSAAALRSDNS